MASRAPLTPSLQTLVQNKRVIERGHRKWWALSYVLIGLAFAVAVISLLHGLGRALIPTVAYDLNNMPVFGPPQTGLGLTIIILGMAACIALLGIAGGLRIVIQNDYQTRRLLAAVEYLIRRERQSFSE